MGDKLFNNKLCTCFLTIGNNCHFAQITDHFLCLGTTASSLIKDQGFFFQLVYIANLSNFPQKISIKIVKLTLENDSRNFSIFFLEKNSGLKKKSTDKGPIFFTH
jgi:hypothetical protein